MYTIDTESLYKRQIGRKSVNLNAYQRYAPSLLRLGIALVFLYFSISQLTAPEDWTGFLPKFLRSSPTPETFILANGGFELAAGILLILGVWVRPVALLLALHLAGIVFTLGFNSIAARDFGLMVATFVVFLNGKDAWCLRRK